MSARTLGGLAGVFVGIAVAMLIGILVIQAIIGGVDTTSWSQQAKGVWDSVISNIWVAFGLLVIIPLVVGAVIILQIIGGGGGGGKGGM